jgi:hypothetical protein
MPDQIRLPIGAASANVVSSAVAMTVTSQL